MIIESTLERETLRFEGCTAFIRPDGILEIDVLPERVITSADIEHHKEAVAYFGSGKPMKTLIRLGRFTVPDNDARMLAADPEALTYKIADAVVTSTMAQNVVARHYVNHNKPSVPTRIFTNVESAIRWLHSVN